MQEMEIFCKIWWQKTFANNRNYRNYTVRLDEYDYTIPIKTQTTSFYLTMTNSHDKNKTLHRCTFSVWCAFRREDPWNSVATSARHLLHPSVLKKFTPLWREFRLEYDASSGYRLHYLLNMMAERWRSWEVSGKMHPLIARVKLITPKRCIPC